jgi:Protein of unknown function (DUF3592)
MRMRSSSDATLTVALVQLKGHARESDQILMARLFPGKTGSPRKPPSPRALAIRRRIFYGFVVFTYVGAWLLISAGLHTRSLGQPISGGVRTSGVVVSERVTHEKGYTYRPIVMFRDTLGRQIEFEGTSRQSPAGIDNSVPVSYDPSDPSHAHDLASTSTWLFQFGAGSCFLLLALGSTWLIWWVRRHGPLGSTRSSEIASPFGE